MEPKTLLHPHPVEILRNLWRMLFLLVIPLVRGFLAALQGGVTQWLRGAWMDVLLLASVLLYSVIKWRSYTISIDSKELEVTWGLLFVRRVKIPVRNIATVCLSRPPFLRLMQGVSVRVDTAAGGSRRPDFSMVLTRKGASALWKAAIEHISPGGGALRRYRPKNIYVALLAAVTSNSFTGITALAAAVTQIGRILGQQFSAGIYGTFERLMRLLARTAPPAATALAFLLIAGWLLTFFRNALSQMRFTVVRKKQSLTVSCGVFTKQSYLIDSRKINYVDISQTLYTKLFRVHTVFIDAFGYGKEKNSVAAMIPAARSEGLQTGLRMLLPDFRRTPIRLRPVLRGLWSFVWQPLLPLAVLLPGIRFLGSWFPRWAQLLRWLGGMAAVPLFWFLAVRLVDFFTGGLGRSGRYYTLRYSRGLSFHTIILPESRVAGLRVRQHFLQKRKGLCDVYFYSYHEGIKRHRIRGLDLGSVRLLLEMDSASV